MSPPSLAAHGADVGDQPVAADGHLDLAADLAGHGDRRVLVRLNRVECGGVHADLRAGTGDFDDLADRRQAMRSRSAFRNRCFLREVADFVQEFMQVRLIVHVRAHSALNHCATAYAVSG